MMMMMAAMLYVYENIANIHHLKPSFKHPKYTIINYLALSRSSGWMFLIFFFSQVPPVAAMSWEGKWGKLSSEKSKRPAKSRIFSFSSRTTVSVSVRAAEWPEIVSLQSAFPTFLISPTWIVRVVHANELKSTSQKAYHTRDTHSKIHK